MPRLLRPDEQDPGVTIHRITPPTPDDPLVYVKTGKASYIKVKRSEAKTFCARHGLAPEWEEQAERKERLARERAARPLPEAGSREALARSTRR